MKSSTELNELFKAMAQFRANVKQPSKSAMNPYFKSTYVQLEGVQNAIDEAIKGTGLSYTQLTHNTDDGIAVETVIMHSSGQWLSTEGLILTPAKKDPQGYGSAITYSRRYQLAAAFGISSDIDNDGNAGTFSTNKPKQQNQRRNKKQQQPSSLNRLQQDYTFLLKRVSEATKRSTKEIQNEVIADVSGTPEQKYKQMNSKLKTMLKSASNR